MDYCSITDEMLELLLGSIRRNQTLIYLSLAGNPLTDASAEKIEITLKTNITLLW